MVSKILLNILIAIIPGLFKAILDRLCAKPKEVEQTAPEALLEVAKQQAEVQHAVNRINAKPKSVSGAIAKLRKRAKPSDGSHS